MIKKIFHILQNYSFNIVPAITVLLSIFLTFLPYKIGNISLFMPFLSLIVIYFWTLYLPQNLPYILILIIGLFKDAVEANILGISALSFLLFQLMIKSQRKYILNNAFIVVWAGFIFCLSAILLLALLFSKLNLNINYYPLPIIFSKWLISIFAYIPIHWLLNKLKIFGS